MYITVWSCMWMSACLIVRHFIDCEHGVCEWMEGHNVNKLYIATCICMIYCEIGH